MPQKTPPQDQAINGPGRAEEESPSPSADAAASSAASSTGSRGGSPFVGEPGAAFDPKNAPPAPEVEVQEELLAIEWEEDQVRRWLILQGEIGHGLVGVAANDWRHTEADLMSIAGPMTRILNRYEPTRAAAAYSDPLSVIFGLGMYSVRSLGERRKALAQLRAQEEVPITGVAAPPGSGPPPDAEGVEWTTQ